MQYLSRSKIFKNLRWKCQPVLILCKILLDQPSKIKKKFQNILLIWNFRLVFHVSGQRDQNYPAQFFLPYNKYDASKFILSYSILKTTSVLSNTWSETLLFVRVTEKQHQGSERPGKSWKTWKMRHAFSRPGKIMEFQKKVNIMEKSWNFKISVWKNHG